MTMGQHDGMKLFFTYLTGFDRRWTSLDLDRRWRFVAESRMRNTTGSRVRNGHHIPNSRNRERGPEYGEHETWNEQRSVVNTSSLRYGFNLIPASNTLRCNGQSSGHDGRHFLDNRPHWVLFNPSRKTNLIQLSVVYSWQFVLFWNRCKRFRELSITGLVDRTTNGKIFVC